MAHRFAPGSSSRSHLCPLTTDADKGKTQEEEEEVGEAMEAAAKEAAHPQPQKKKAMTEKELTEPRSNNLCRCG